MIPIMARELILLRWELCGLGGGLVSAGTAVGDEETVVFGLTGDAIAPPGWVGLLETTLHFSSGGPHKPGLFQNDEAGKPENEPDSSPVSLFPETLKSCKFGKFMPEMEPEKEFSSSRSVSKCVSRFTAGGMPPEKLLYDRSRR